MVNIGKCMLGCMIEFIIWLIKISYCVCSSISFKLGAYSFSMLFQIVELALIVTSALLSTLVWHVFLSFLFISFDVTSKLIVEMGTCVDSK